MIQRNKAWIDLANKLYEIQQKISFLEDEKSKLHKELQILSDHKDSCAAGYEFKECSRAGIVNYKIIPELKDLDLSQYRNSDVSYWKLTYKKPFKEIL